MRAEVALLNRLNVLVQINRVVRTRLHTSPATNACVTIDVDNPIFALRERIDRTDRYARRVGAMIAALNQEQPLNIGERANLGVLDRGPKPPDGDIVLGFAGDGAGMAADAGLLVDDEPVLHGRILLGVGPEWLGAGVRAGPI